MTSQQTRTTTKQSDKASRQPKPKPVGITPAGESNALQRTLHDPANASAQDVLVAQKRVGNKRSHA